MRNYDSIFRRIYESANTSYTNESFDSVYEIPNEYFTNPRVSVVLPELPQSIQNATRVTTGKNILIKKNIFDKNLSTHPEIGPFESKRTLALSLYEPNCAMLAHAKTKQNYWSFVKIGSYFAVCVVDVDPEKNFHEVVGWRVINKAGFERMKKQVSREGGQFLISDDSL